jgi:hypothetical protein
MYHKAGIRASVERAQVGPLLNIPAIGTAGDRQVRQNGSWGTGAARSLGLALGVPLILAGLLNFLVNPLGLYSFHILPATEQNLRRFKYEQVRDSGLKPTSVILGSSRVMTMRSSDVEQHLGGACYNFSMQSAAAEDWYAALRLLVDDLGAPVEDVILGVDFEAFNPAIPTMSESRYFAEFSKYLVHTKLRSRWLDQWSLLLSSEQLDATKGVLTTQLQRGRESQNKVVEPDGTLLLRHREELIASGRFDLDDVLDARVRKYASRSLRLAGYERPSEERLQYLADLLDFCDQRDIRLHVYITPYHPRLWDTLRPLPGIEVLRETRRRVQQQCAMHGVYVVDFSRADRFGADPREFYDEIHMWPSNQARLLQTLFAIEQTYKLQVAGAETPR